MDSYQDHGDALCTRGKIRPSGCLLKRLDTTSSHSSSSTKAKQVSFNAIEIREFPIELGDNPAVSWKLVQILSRVIEIHFPSISPDKNSPITSRLSLETSLIICQVHSGPPIQIGWTPNKVNLLELDEYEIFRRRRRDKHALSISTDERIARLLSQGYTIGEIRNAITDVARARQDRFDSVVCQPLSFLSSS